MKNLVVEKLKTLLNDLEINRRKEEEDGKSYFTTELFAIRIKEIIKILDN